MTGTVLLTLGRLPKGLDLARSFARAGGRVLVADPHRRHLVGASRSVARSFQVAPPAESPARYLDDLAAIIARENVDLVLPVSEEILYVSALHGRVDPRVRVFAMPQAELLALHDKAGFVDVARAAGLNVPDSAIGGTPASASISTTGDVIVKPRHGCAGGGVRRFKAGAPIDAGPDDVVQRFVPGAERSACALAHEGVMQGCAIYRGFVMSGTVAVAFERVDDPPILRWVEAFVAATRFTGFISFDFIVDDAGTPWGIECNPRLTSGVHFMMTQDLAPAIMQSRQQVRLRPERRLQQFWACLTETQGRFGQWPAFRRNLANLFRTPDVTWSASDPWPLIGMPWTAWPIISASRARRVSFGEAASRDILWREEGGAVASGSAWPSARSAA